MKIAWKKILKQKIFSKKILEKCRPFSTPFKEIASSCYAFLVCQRGQML